MREFQELSADQLQSLLRQREPAVALVDVRTPAEVARGGIAGARNIPLHLLPIAGQELVRDAHLVFYCQTGARSAQACAYMTTQGYANVYNLRGGIVGWKRALVAPSVATA